MSVTPSTDILYHHPDQRLARLEAADLARHFRTETSALRQAVDRAIAGIENRLIEHVLMRRLRRGLHAARQSATSETMLSEMRGAYSTGSMETLPSFLPSPAYQGALDSPSGQKGQKANRPTILYTAGGGFMFPLSGKQKRMIQRLAEGTGCEIVPGTHRLAPEHPFPAAPYDIAEQYEGLLDSGVDHRKLFLGGDTAGASITLGALQVMRQQDLPMPAGIVLFAPWCDLALTGWSYITGSATGQSPFRMETAAFCARVYLQDDSPFDPLASPIHADMTGWPPILIHTSRYDMHFDDALKLVENGTEAGCSIRINYWDSPRHHLERLSSGDADRSFREVSKFVTRAMSGNA